MIHGPGAEVQGGQDEGRHGWWQVPQEEVGQGQGAGALGRRDMGMLGWLQNAGGFAQKQTWPKGQETTERVHVESFIYLL